MGFYERLSVELQEAKRTGGLRALPAVTGDGVWATLEGRRLLNLSGNDYLGLSARHGLTGEFFDSLGGGKFPSMSASSSRLLTGNHPEYRRLEEELSSLFAGRAALVTNSGYHANVGALSALAGEEDLILSDELNHASIIDGIRLSKARRLTYPHLDLARLEELLAENRSSHREVFVVTESLFSMDGDAVDLKALVELKNRYGALLYLDEAHAFGVFGPTGLGLAEAAGVAGEVDFLVGTFGKALCSVGAFVVCEPVVREYLVNHMRTLLFTTGLPPLTVAWTRFALGLIKGMGRERAILASLSASLRAGIAGKGESVPGSSQIVPLILGSNEAAVSAGARLREAGFLAFPIRPPTVPKGRSRLRFSLNAAMAPADIDRLIEAL